MRRSIAFPVILTPDRKDGGYVVTCRDLPEAITQGDTVADTLEQAEGALEAAIEARIEDGLDITSPSRPRRGERIASVPVATALKAALYVEMREKRVSKSQLARKLGVNEKEARRILDPHHSTKVPTLERALSVLGKRVTVEIQDAA